jgi:hypothetical protein
MEYPVLKKFRDKGSGEIYEVGVNYEADSERGADLQRRGFLGQNEEKREPKRTNRSNSQTKSDKS